MIQVYKIRFNTVNLTLAAIKKWYSTDVPTDEQLQAFLEAYQALHGVECAGIQFSLKEGNWTIAGWEEKDADKFRDWIYQIEQDDMFGQYIDDYECFLKDWEAGEYEPMASWSIIPELIEKLEPMNNLEIAKTEIIDNITNQILAAGHENDGYYKFSIERDMTQVQVDELNVLFAADDNYDGLLVTGEVGKWVASVDYKAALN